jgi:hypothetical protein
MEGFDPAEVQAEWNPSTPADVCHGPPQADRIDNKGHTDYRRTLTTRFQSRSRTLLQMVDAGHSSRANRGSPIQDDFQCQVTMLPIANLTSISSVPIHMGRGLAL